MASLLTKYVYTNQSQEEEEIDDSIDLSINLGSEIKNNQIRTKLKNDPIDVFSDGIIKHRWVNENKEIKFRAIKPTPGQAVDEEIIDIYAHWTELDPTIDVESTDYLLMSGVINKGKAKYTEGEHSIELQCVDRNFIILNKLTIPQAFKESDGETAATIIPRLIQNGCENSDSNAQGFDSSGNQALGYPFLIDARSFSGSIITSGTTTSASSRKLINTGDTFQTDGVEKDDWVRNTSTDEYAYVVSVDSETQLTLSKDIMTSGVGYQISDGFVQDTRPDGTAFPDISFAQLNKPITESVATLSQIDSTNTTAEADTSTGTLIVKRAMRWFIDKRNRFHWYVPSDTPEYIMKVGTNTAISPDAIAHKIIDVDLTREVTGDVNFIIFKAGEDMNGLMIKSYARAQFSGVPNEKECLRHWLEIARSMKAQEEQAGNITKSAGDTFNYPGSYNPLPNGDTYPTWDSTKSSIPTSDSEYNALFITEAIKEGTKKARAEFLELANPRWSGKVQIRGEPIIIGDLIQFTSEPHGITDLKFRVNQVTHTIKPKEGWITVLNVLEDEREFQVGL